jgi:hypothetical protein
MALTPAAPPLIAFASARPSRAASADDNDDAAEHASSSNTSQGMRSFYGRHVGDRVIHAEDGTTHHRQQMRSTTSRGAVQLYSYNQAGRCASATYDGAPPVGSVADVAPAALGSSRHIGPNVPANDTHGDVSYDMLQQFMRSSLREGPDNERYEHRDERDPQRQQRGTASVSDTRVAEGIQATSTREMEPTASAIGASRVGARDVSAKDSARHRSEAYEGRSRARASRSDANAASFDEALMSLSSLIVASTHSSPAAAAAERGSRSAPRGSASAELRSGDIRERAAADTSTTTSHHPPLEPTAKKPAATAATTGVQASSVSIDGTFNSDRAASRCAAPSPRRDVGVPQFETWTQLCKGLRESSRLVAREVAAAKRMPVSWQWYRYGESPPRYDNSSDDDVAEDQGRDDANHIHSRRHRAAQHHHHRGEAVSALTVTHRDVVRPAEEDIESPRCVARDYVGAPREYSAHDPQGDSQLLDCSPIGLMAAAAQHDDATFAAQGWIDETPLSVETVPRLPPEPMSSRATSVVSLACPPFADSRHVSASSWRAQQVAVLPRLGAFCDGTHAARSALSLANL